MANQNIGFVSNKLIAPSPAPAGQVGPTAWIRKNLLATPKDVVLTVIALAVLAYILPGIINWLFINAVWIGSNRMACLTTSQGGAIADGQVGACWAFVGAKFQQFVFGRYPSQEYWRPILVMIMFAALLIPMLMPKAPFKGWNALLLFIALPVVAFFLLTGGFGLPHVETTSWGGLMVTLILSFFGIAVSLPVGILLALGRRSTMPVIKTLCVIFIEVVRGVPLITVLFMASVMLPLFQIGRAHV